VWWELVVTRWGWQRWRGHVPRGVPAAALLGLTLLGTAACGARPSADAFTHGYVTGIGGSRMQVGSKLGYLFAYLQNKSGQPLVIQAISFRGRGLGSVVRPVKEEVAPLSPHVTVVDAGGYVTDPPVAWTRQGCLAQTLRPLHGYHMGVGGRARLWVVFQAVGTGRYSLPDYTIYYLQAGTHQRQVLSEGYSGVVARKAPAAETSPSPLQMRCLSHTTLLNPSLNQRAAGAVRPAGPPSRQAAGSPAAPRAGSPDRPAAPHAKRAGSQDRRATPASRQGGASGGQTSGGPMRG
jgi:hypothetical protein